MKILLYILPFTLNLLSCGNSSNVEEKIQPIEFPVCEKGVVNYIEGLEYRFVQNNNQISLSGIFKKEGSYEQDFFFLKGKLADKEVLTEAIGNRNAIINCSDKLCQVFSIEVKSEKIGLKNLIQFKRFDPRNGFYSSIKELDMNLSQASDVRGDSIGQFRNEDQSWRYAMENRDLKQSNLITSCVGAKNYFSLVIAGKNDTRLGSEWYAVSGEYPQKIFGSDHLQLIGDKPIQSVSQTAMFEIEISNNTIYVESEFDSFKMNF